jgi:hypothetical protein
MRNIQRKPLFWMVLAECAIVAALVIVTWHLIASVPTQALLRPPTASPTQAADSTTPLPADITVPPPSKAQLPGLNIDANFWRSRLAQLNGGEKAFEQLEWKLVHSVMDAAKRYVESVVIPSIATAERSKS